MKFGTPEADKFIQEANQYKATSAKPEAGYRDITDVLLPEKASEFTKKSFDFGTRMTKAEDSIRQFEDEYANQSAATSYLGQIAPNFLKSSDRQLFEQAERDWVNAKLRQESGAVISDQEFDNAKKQYFPQPGDSKEVIAQKRANRETATRTMLSNAGRDENGVPIARIYDQTKSTTDATSTPTTSNILDRIKQLRASNK